jgi:hypothetical protein
MIVESLIGTALGGLLRLLPEGLKFWEGKKSQDHEYRMGQLSLEQLKFQAQSQLDLRRVESETTIAAADIQALMEANKAQASMVINTGIKWVDAIIVAMNALMRPTIVYYYAAMYALVKVAVFYTYLGDGVDWKASMIVLWSNEDMAVWASIMSYVFLDRSLRKQR